MNAFHTNNPWENRAHMSSSVDFEVGIIGGGPAGSSMAAYLAKNGVNCVVFEKELMPREHVGESLVPVFDPRIQRSRFPSEDGGSEVSPQAGRSLDCGLRRQGLQHGFWRRFGGLPRRHPLLRARAGCGPELHLPRRSRQVRPDAAAARQRIRRQGVRRNRRHRRRLQQSRPREREVHHGQEGNGNHLPHRGGRLRPQDDCRQPDEVAHSGQGLQPVRHSHLVRRLRPPLHGLKQADPGRLHLHPLPADHQHLGVADSDQRDGHFDRRSDAESRTSPSRRKIASSSSGSASRAVRNSTRASRRRDRNSASHSRKKATTATR